MVKEMNEARKTPFHPIENINKDMETIFFKSQMENLQLKLQ